MTQKTLNKPLSVSEFVTLVKTHLQTAIGQIIVQGEVSGFKTAKGTLVFFELKDKQSRVTCFMMKWNLNTSIEDGMEVKVTGYPSLFQNSGRFHVRVLKIEPVGEGALQRAFELLKQKLEKEGLFAPERKREIPRFPTKIGLVTSPDAAAYTDVLKILGNRWGGLDIIFTPVGVQGQEAINQIVGAIEYQNKVIKPSVIILTRGGGSLEDLQAFNSEEVARAVFSSKIPIVCGVGHERDITIADLVADVRASTPSNAAERVVPDRREILFEINTLIDSAENQLQAQLRNLLENINDSVRRLENIFREKIQHWQEIKAKLQKHFWLFAQRINFAKKDVSGNVRRLLLGFKSDLTHTQTKIINLEKLLGTLNPEGVLARGYSLTQTADGRIIKNSAEVELNQTITTKLARGRLDSKIIKKQ